MKKSPALLAFLWLASLVLASCIPEKLPPPGTETPTVTETPAATTAPSPTRTPRPRVTFRPRLTRTPTANLTPSDTATPVPTLTLTTPPNPEPRPRSGHVFARHQGGQTFITWDEQAGLKGERYRVYRSGRAITTKNLDRATWLAEVSRDSGVFYANRYLDTASGTWRARNFKRYPIRDNGTELEEGYGLLVWTPIREDLDNQDTGVSYYAITVFLPDGSEILPDGYTTGPVAETAGDPDPIDARYNASNRTHVMIQFMDLRTWNPSYHAPNLFNSFYGLPPDDAVFPGSLQYAYDYIVQEPYCPTQPASVPVVLVLHDRTAFHDLTPNLSNEMAVWCAYKIYALDPGDTGWFGFAEIHDFRQNTPVEDGDVVTNFTEQRLLRMIYDLARRPPTLPVDTNRIYVIGHGLGGTGAIALGMRYGDIFAAAYASDPLTIPSDSGPSMTTMLKVPWGERRFHLPVSISAPLDWAKPLDIFTGLDVWEWQDLTQISRLRSSLDFAPLGIAHSINDPLIAWNTQGATFYSPMDKSRQAWGAIITRDGHAPQYYDGLPPSLQPNNQYIPFAGLAVKLRETVPGISSGRGDFRAPSSPHDYNHTILWSSSWNPWDGAPIDMPDLYQISLCAVGREFQDSQNCGTGEPEYVNITPRRVQSFTIVPGVRYQWENRQYGNDALIATGRVTAAADGTITIRRVLVLPEGVRLTIRLLPEGNE